MAGANTTAPKEPLRHRADGLYFTSHDQLERAGRDYDMRSYVGKVFFKSVDPILERTDKVPVTLALITDMQRRTKCVGALTNAMRRARHITPTQCSSFMTRYSRLRYGQRGGTPDSTRCDAAVLFMDLLAKRARREKRL